MSSAMSAVMRSRSTRVSGRLVAASTSARTARTLVASSSASRLASYSCGPSCCRSSVWTFSLRSSNRSLAASLLPVVAAARAWLVEAPTALPRPDGPAVEPCALAPWLVDPAATVPLAAGRVEAGTGAAGAACPACAPWAVAGVVAGVASGVAGASVGTSARRLGRGDCAPAPASPSPVAVVRFRAARRSLRLLIALLLALLLATEQATLGRFRLRVRGFAGEAQGQTGD